MAIGSGSVSDNAVTRQLRARLACDMKTLLATCVLAIQRNRKNLEAVTELCASGKVIPVIDIRCPLSKVPEALRDLGDGQQSKLVITV